MHSVSKQSMAKAIFLCWTDKTLMRRLYCGCLAVLFLLQSTNLYAAIVAPVCAGWEKPDGIDKGKALTQLVQRIRSKDPQCTLKFGYQALAHFENFPDNNRKITVLNSMAWAYMTLGQYDNAKIRAKQSLAVAEQFNDEHGKYSAYNILGLIAWRMTDYQTAIDHYRHGLAIAESLNDQRGISVTLNNMAIINDILGQHEQALSYFLRAMQLKQAIGDLTGAAVVISNIAEIYSRYGDYSLALQYQFQSLKIRQLSDDLAGLAEVNGNIGITYLGLNDLNAAESHIRRSLAQFTQLQDKLGIAEGQASLGRLFERRQDYDKAMMHFTQSLDIARKIGDKEIQSRIGIHVAQILLAKNHLPQALDEAKNAVLLAQELGIKTLLGKGRVSLGQVYLAMGQPKVALEYADSALLVAEKQKDKLQMAQSHQLLSQIKQQQNQPWLALRHYQQFKLLNDDIYVNADQQRSNLLRVHFAAHQQQSEMAKLKADKVFNQYRLERQTFERNAYLLALCLTFVVVLLMLNRRHQHKVNLALKQNVDSQQQLIRAISHEFRAPLARVQLAFDLLMEESSLQSPLQQQVNQGLEDLENLVKEALSFLRNESPHSQSTAVAIGFKPVLDKLFSQQAALYPDIEFVYICMSANNDELPTLYADPNQFTRVIGNLLENAARHAKSTVRVSAGKVGNRLEINIEDDGTGIPAAMRERVFEPFVRLDPSRNRRSGGIGLGLSLVKSIVDGHQATIVCLASEMGGAKFSLRWPIK